MAETTTKAINATVIKVVILIMFSFLSLLIRYPYNRRNGCYPLKQSLSLMRCKGMNLTMCAQTITDKSQLSPHFIDTHQTD